MAKRKRRQSAELPLFDLPLQPGEPASGEEVPDSAGGEVSAPGPAGTPGPSLLYDDEDAAPGGEEQLDLVDLAGPAGGEEPESEGPEAGAELEDDETYEDVRTDDRALLGDRLLGGFADLAVQLVMSGLALAAVHSMGVTVSWADWMPFAVLALVFSFLYWVVPLAFWGQTPGMAWVGHSARAGGGEALTFGQTFRRWLGALVTLVLAGLPMLLALTGRSFTDRISDSYTIAEP